MIEQNPQVGSTFRTFGLGTLAALAMLFVGFSGSMAHATQPTAGYYKVVAEVTSIGGTCPAPLSAFIYKGNIMEGSFFYPGPGKKGALIHFPLVTYQQSSESIFLFTVAFTPSTPAQGLHTWSGNFTASVMPPGATATGNFAAALSFADSTSFMAKFSKFNIVIGPATCKAALNVILVAE